ncbi:hypothetical protein MSMEI_6050 [Mycolicibacterium smegmatis MC2 155]|uniref:Uncharacterized protein n=2 Tax=Mycolicibacterium smegmatis (strain ATCC 700084 / mc(2)155) TaxID=246196 RepID=I7GFI4_MYCS2|nr:hypothetical protein MSMEI_6050 [Mycolicibacterium smegmatis MC2 155]
MGRTLVMPRGDGIYDEEHRDHDTGSAAEGGAGKPKRVPEDTPDVEMPDETTQEPPD